MTMIVIKYANIQGNEIGQVHKMRHKNNSFGLFLTTKNLQLQFHLHTNKKLL